MSKKKLLLVGAGGFGRMVAEQAMFQYDCAFVDSFLFSFLFSVLKIGFVHFIHDAVHILRGQLSAGK